MKSYGYFDSSAKEYVITRPDTPLPWLNYLGSDHFFGLCTNTAGGYTFWKDAKLRRITRYRYNDMPMDNGGRYLYIKDGDTIWNPGWKPMRTELDAYECRHGLGYTKIKGEKNGLEVEMLVFIAPNENVEIWKTTIRNKSDSLKDVQLFSFIEFCLYDALNDMSNLQRTYNIGEVEVEGSCIYHLTEYRERRTHFALFACTHDISGFDTSRETFVGVHNGLHDPLVPLSGLAKNSLAHGWNPIGSHQLDLHLRGGESKTFAFLLAYVEQGYDSTKYNDDGKLNKIKGQNIVRKYSNVSAVEAAYKELNESWQNLLSRYQTHCPDRDVNLMTNTWNQYQCMTTFNLSRSASLFETGIGRGMGFRDSNQDLLGFVHMVPEKARERILDIAATQLSDGTCYHQYQPLTKKGNSEIGGDFYDDHLWLILSVCAYIKETGDKSLLDEPIGYADLENSCQSLLHHLETSVQYTLSHRGPHGLPLIGHADWNDCLNLNCFSVEPNESFQTAGDVEGSIAESVMIAGLFLYATREMKELYGWLNDSENAAKMGKHHAEMLDVVEKQAWDGKWYLRAFDATGKPVGSSQCQEGQIFIESQAWCLLGGAGEVSGRTEQVLESIHQHLYTEDGILLQQPAYSKYYPELGEISSYPPGYKENAGIFSHNNTWIHLALCKYGFGERALEYYHSICPSTKEEKIDIYKSEPYVYAQMTAGRDAATSGEAKNSWLTGTAAWTFVVVSQGILGVYPTYRGLKIDPCIPKDWKTFKVERVFRNTKYNIHYKNPSAVNKGIKRITVNGKIIVGNTIPLNTSVEPIDVEVIMGC